MKLLIIARIFINNVQTILCENNVLQVYSIWYEFYSTISIFAI